MGIFSRKINKNAKNPPKIVGDYYAISNTPAKIDGFAFRNIDRIAFETATLNYGIYDVKTRQKVRKHPLYAVLKEPNLDDRHFNFIYQSVKDYYNGGILWLKSKYEGEIISLFRLNPLKCTITRDQETNRRLFKYGDKIYTSDDVIYIPSRFDYSTLTGGASIFDAVDNVFKTSSTLEKYTQKTFANGMLGKRTVIDVSQAFPDLTAEQARDIKDSFQNEYSGAENASRPLLKQKGIEYSDIGSASDNQAAELTENKKIQNSMMDAIFQMPSESFDTEKYFLFLNEFAVKPIATQIQEAINTLLDEDRFYFEFDYNGIMKVSLSQRINSYQAQINNGMMSPNEARAKENLPPIEAGDNYFMPVNLMPLNDETINAYMAKQKNEINNANPTDPDAQHFGGGDDKQ